MKKKPTRSAPVSCPVPPWTPKNILALSKFLALSQVKLAEHLGISYSSLRAWISGRTKAVSPRMQSFLKKFEKKIPKLRAFAVERLEARKLREERKFKRLAKPMAVSNIRVIMRRWGMSQAEFAMFCGVSYDSVTSWSRGRRRLVRVDLAERVHQLEELATRKGFPKVGPNTRVNPWMGLRDFVASKIKPAKYQRLPGKPTGSFQVIAVETAPGAFRAGRSSEKLTIKPPKGKGPSQLKLILGAQEITLSGTLRTMGGVDFIQLEAGEKDPSFLFGQAGCVNLGKQFLRISLWSSKKLPIRVICASVR